MLCTNMKLDRSFNRRRSNRAKVIIFIFMPLLWNILKGQTPRKSELGITLVTVNISCFPVVDYENLICGGMIINKQNIATISLFRPVC